MKVQDDGFPRLASGARVTPPLCASFGQKLWLGNQEAFSGDWWVLEEINESEEKNLFREEGGGQVIYSSTSDNAHSTILENHFGTITTRIEKGYVCIIDED